MFETETTDYIKGGPGIDLSKSENALKVFAKVEPYILGFFKPKKDVFDEPKYTFSIKKRWREIIQKIYDAITLPWKTDYNPKDAKTPKFDFYSPIGERVFVSVIVKPTKDHAQIPTSEYLDLLKQRDDILKELKDIEHTIHANESEIQRYGQLKNMLKTTNEMLWEIEDELLWGPRIIKKAGIMPYYKNVTIVSMKPGTKRPSYEHLPPSRTLYQPSEEEKKSKNIIRVNWGRECLIWNDLTAEEKSGVTQNLQALDEQLDKIMVKV